MPNIVEGEAIDFSSTRYVARETYGATVSTIEVTPVSGSYSADIEVRVTALSPWVKIGETTQAVGFLRVLDGPLSKVRLLKKSGTGQCFFGVNAQ